LSAESMRNRRPRIGSGKIFALGRRRPACVANRHPACDCNFDFAFDGDPIPGVASSMKQLFEAVDQSLNRERFDQIFHIMLGQKERDSCIGRKPGDENKPIGQRRSHFLCLQIEFVTTQPRHLQIADYRVVFVGLDLEQSRSSIKGDINEKILVRQDPLQGGRQLLVVIDHQNGLQRETIDMRLKSSRMRLGFHYDASSGQQSWCQVAGIEADIWR
jgi:hypothetical protein